jgi:riboflavin kinase/FMN adenylyltransferase
MKNKNCIARRIALGYFDGVHLGHAAVLKNAASVFTFNSRESNNITTDETKHKLLKSLGIKDIFSYDFESIKNFSPEEFVSEILVKELGAEAVCVGCDFRFGKEAKADAEELAKLCNKFDVQTIIVPPVEIDGTVVSSTRIREFIRKGEIETANKFLGYELFYELEVVGGNQLGRTIGFPTINQNMPENCISPRFGVYMSRAAINGCRYKGITNIGIKPTAGKDNKNITIETHILNYDNDLYGEIIEVKLLGFIRPEKKFNNFEELSQQIKEDLKWTK